MQIFRLTYKEHGGENAHHFGCFLDRNVLEEVVAASAKNRVRWQRFDPAVAGFPCMVGVDDSTKAQWLVYSETLIQHAE